MKTEWKRIGRSGPTIDGRNIEAEALTQAAQSYDPALYTALIWPEHFRWYNLGKIVELRSAANDEGGVDLFAKIEPNQYYQDAVKYGQKLFTSMELLPNFRDTNAHYLTGCAATDSPASAATSEMRFSASNKVNGVAREGALGEEKALLLSQHIEFTSHQFEGDSQDDTAPSWFTKLFKSNTEDDMSKEAIEALQTELAALSEQFKALGKKEDPAADKADDKTDDFAALTASIKALDDRFTAVESKKDDDKEGEATLQLTAMQTALDDLTGKFNAALEETGGTPAGEDTGGEDMRKYI